MYTASEARELAKKSDKAKEDFFNNFFKTVIETAVKEGKYSTTHILGSQEPWRSVPDLSENMTDVRRRLLDLKYRVEYTYFGALHKPRIFNDIDCDERPEVKYYGFVISW